MHLTIISNLSEVHHYYQIQVISYYIITMLLGTLQFPLANNIIQSHSSNCSNIVHFVLAPHHIWLPSRSRRFSVWSILLFTFGYFYQLSDVSYTWSLLRLMCMLRVQLKYLFYLGGTFWGWAIFTNYQSLSFRMCCPCIVLFVSMHCSYQSSRHCSFSFFAHSQVIFSLLSLSFSLSSSQSDFRVSLQKWIYMCVHAWLGTVTYHRHWQSFWKISILIFF